MQVRHLRTVNPGSDAPNKVTAVAWCPSSTRLAVATADRVISLFDENGEQRRDKFPTKPVRVVCPGALLPV
jgi:intraflagellar transport protein 172